jgi:hypothetical protein
MLEGDINEIRMGINSCFVKRHEYWENGRGKNWIARITGLDKKYGYKREFLEPVRIGTETVFRLEDFHIGEIYEIASISAGGVRHIKLKDAFECTEITETYIVLRYLTQEEVIERLGEENIHVIANSLVQQLLRIVTKDQALELIQRY